MWYKIQKIYVGSQQVWPKWWGFTPWVNTLSYLPLTAETKLTDYWTLGWTWTITWTEWTWYVWGTNYWETKWNSNTTRMYTWANAFATYTTYTVCLRIKMSSNVGDFTNMGNRDNWDNWNITYYYDKIRHYASGSMDYTFSPTLNDNTWHSLIVTMSPTAYWKCYLDGVLYKTVWANKVLRPQYVTLNSARTSWGSSWGWAMYFSDFILEDRERTADEVAAYYDSIKWNYGK